MSAFSHVRFQARPLSPEAHVVKVVKSDAMPMSVTIRSDSIQKRNGQD
jgi:hypothetical protein